MVFKHLETLAQIIKLKALKPQNNAFSNFKYGKLLFLNFQQCRHILVKGEK